MLLESIKLKQFKNHSDFFGQWQSGFNFIVGPNGVGKTNIIDAIYYTAMLKSYFHNSDKQITQKGTDFYRLEALFSQDNYLYKLEVKSSSQIKEIKWDGNVIDKIVDHVGKIPVVLISPDDIFYFFNESEERRKFLNQTIIQFDQNYLNYLIRYTKALKLRNALLKNFNNSKEANYLLDSYDQVLVQTGIYIANKRREVVSQLQIYLEVFVDQISNNFQKSTMIFKSQVDADFDSVLKQNRHKDIVTQRSNFGIHKDQLECTIDLLPIREFGSQGQLKSFILALRLAQYKLMKQIAEKSPMVLLDDIFAKLDADRVNNLLACLEQESVVQCFITDTHIDRIKQLENRIHSNTLILNLSNTNG